MDYSDIMLYGLDELTSDSSGDILQAIMNTPKYWSTKNLEASLPDMVDVARGQSLEDAAELKKSGFQNVRSKDINLGTGMNRGVFVGYGDDAKKIGSMYAKNNPYRGTTFGDVTGEVFTGKVPKRSMQFSRNVWGHPQAVISAGVANKAFNLPGGGIMDAIKKSRATKFLSKFFPGANIALGAKSAYDRFNKGQYLRAGADLISTIPGPIGWGGLGAATVGDLISNADSGYNTNVNKNINPRIDLSNRSGGNQGGGNQGGGNQGGGGQAAGQRASAVSRPSGNAGYSNVRRYGRAQGGIASLWQR